MKRTQQLHLFVAFFTTLVVLLISNVVPIAISPALGVLLLSILSVLIYQILFIIARLLINSNQLLLRLYWRKLYLDGLWSYTYLKEGDQDNKRYFGIWRFTQDIYGTRVEGFGLTDDFQVRSRVKSIIDMRKNGENYEVINIRFDTIQVERDNYSITSMTFDTESLRAFDFPKQFKSRTTILGGKLERDIHIDTFNKHVGLREEESVLEELKKNYPQTSD